MSAEQHTPAQQCAFVAPPGDFASVRDIDPYPFYEAKRNEAPLVWDEAAKGWLVTSYDVCRHVEVNEDRFRHFYADMDPADREIKGGENISVSLGERHALLHRFGMRLFARREMESYLEHHIQPVIEDLLSRIVQRKRIDLTAEFLDLIPPRIIISLLNIPWKDDHKVRDVIKLHEVIFDWASGLNPKVAPQAKLASTEISKIMLPYIRERRDNPGNDLISRMWTDWPQELGQADETAVLAICRDIFMGGSDTTTHVLANLFYILLTDATVMDAVRTDRASSLENLIEEALRLYGAVQYRPRMANADCELGGVKVAKDDLLILINSAANRDPSVFERPNEVNLKRPKPTEHLAFNKGPRMCVGASLARAEIASVVNAFLDRFDDVRLDPDAAPPLFSGHVNRSFRPLNVLLSAR